MAKSKEYRAFVAMTDKLLAAPRETIQQRLRQHRDESIKNPHKRGPKPKATASGSGHEDA